VTSLIALLSVFLFGAQQPPNVNVVVDDARLAVWISYTASATSGIFTARLRPGFTFSVNVDGDQNARWGAGAYDKTQQAVSPPPTSEDVSFDMSSEKPCKSYIFFGHPREALRLRQENADAPYAISDCGNAPFSFTVRKTASDRPGFDLTTYTIPKAELFGKRPDAHVLLEVVGDTVSHGYYSLANPLVIAR
jgi:hypothetical protein